MRYWLLAAAGFLTTASAPAFATIHTLDFSGNICHSTSDPGPCFSAVTNTPISQSYGDDATIDISHRGLSTAGATTTDYLIWDGSAGNLTNVAYTLGDLGEIGFAPASGYEVSLTSFDIACGNTSCAALAYEVLTANGDLITRGSGLVPTGATHVSFQPDTAYFDQAIVLRWNSPLDLEIDNVVFDVRQSAAPVPEPASWAMMLGGFGLIGSAMRRRRAEAALT